MDTNSKHNPEINQLLIAWSEGDQTVENQLIEALYPHIHRIAHFQFKSATANSLQTTEIVNEAFILLSKQQSVAWKNKNHFLAIASKVIRRVMIDHHRSESRQKRGGHLHHVTVDRIQDLIEEPDKQSLDWLELNDLLNSLSQVDQEAALVVECKIFGGLTVAEIAEVLSKSEATVSRIWQYARSWLLLQHQ